MQQAAEGFVVEDKFKTRNPKFETISSDQKLEFFWIWCGGVLTTKDTKSTKEENIFEDSIPSPPIFVSFAIFVVRTRPPPPQLATGKPEGS
jgi:hypothetical protein